MAREPKIPETKLSHTAALILQALECMLGGEASQAPDDRRAKGPCAACDEHAAHPFAACAAR